MDLQRINVKFFAENPSAVKLDEFIPIFHRWIRGKRVEGILIDVADYGHLPNGPGVVLIGHEADYFMDSAEGPLGLLYNRKTPLEGTPADRIKTAFQSALTACAKLEEEPELRGKLKFRAGEALFLINDRLNAPNTDATFAECRPHLEKALTAIYPGLKIDLRRDAADPRRRFAVRISGGR